jgi:hypothetical protein
MQMKAFDFIQATISHNPKTRILKLWNPTASLPGLRLRHNLQGKREGEGSVFYSASICKTGARRMAHSTTKLLIMILQI